MTLRSICNRIRCTSMLPPPHAHPLPHTPMHTRAKTRKIRHLFFSHMKEVMRQDSRAYRAASQGQGPNPINSVLLFPVYLSCTKWLPPLQPFHQYSRKKERRRKASPSFKRYLQELTYHIVYFMSARIQTHDTALQGKRKTLKPFSAEGRHVQFKIKVSTSKKKRENGYLDE